MFKEKYLKAEESLRRFFNTDYYMLLLLAGAGIFIFTGQEVLGTYILSIISAVSFFIGLDVLPAFQGIMIMASFVIRCKYSTDEFLSIWPLGIPVIILFFARFVRFRPKLRKGGLTYGLAATSVAILLGGAGIIYWKTYFSPTSLFYMGMLGFCMLIFYGYFNSILPESKGYDFAERFSKLMVGAIITLCISLVYEYTSRWDEFRRVMSVIPFQWRNNGATILMLAMPFAFYLSLKKFPYFFVGLLSWAAIIFTGSRGGLIFGSAELAICLIVMLIADRKHRKYIAAVIAAGCIGLVVCAKYMMEILSYTIQRLLDPDENSIRLEMIERGINDFRSSPFVGRGLAYMGNRDVHASAKHTLCWYHCSLVQVPASFGIVGIAAYIFLNIQRILVFIRNRTPFSVTMFISFIGLEMMSLVNPGIFAPVPYLFTVTMYFSIMEFVLNKSKTEPEKD